MKTTEEREGEAFCLGMWVGGMCAILGALLGRLIF